jgi:hypothetical protein
MILLCDKGCQHKEQDKFHGKGRRVHNEMKGKVAGSGSARCTVCQNEKAVKVSQMTT